MNDSHPLSIIELKEFLKVAQGYKYTANSIKEKYAWINEVLEKFKYHGLCKKEKSVVKNYLVSMTGYSDLHVKRLIGKKLEFGTIYAGLSKRPKFKTIYTTDDIALLVKTDNAHNRLSGPATKQILQRAWNVFKDKAYEKLSKISSSHLYRLRGKRQYVSHSKTFACTQAVNTNIGIRRKPRNEGKPGYLRVDSVHQGDLDKQKGVYHINF